MNPNKKVFITVLSFVLAMVVIACSCSSLIPTGTTSPSGQEAMPGLAGKWTSPDTNDVFDIAWQNGKYVLLSATWKGTSYNITSQSWDGSTLTWAYLDTDLNLTVTLSTISLNGTVLDIHYSESDGNSGDTTLNRVP